MSTRHNGWLKRVDSILSRCELVLVSVAIAMSALMVAIISFSALTRYFFGWPSAWSLEISEHIMLYITFFSASWILSNNKHVSLTIITDRFSIKAQMIVGIFIGGLIVCASLILFWYGWKATLDSYLRNVMSVGVMPVPKHWVLFAIPAGSLVLLLRSLQQLAEKLTTFFGSMSNPSQHAELPQNYRKV